MAAINRVILLGRLTKDVEIRKSGNGSSFCKFTVAVDRYSKDKESQADFPQVTAFNQSADYLGNYGRKGLLISVEGSIKTGSYQDRDGKKIYTTDVIADRVQILESKKSGNEYPSAGMPLRKDEIRADDGFETETSDTIMPLGGDLPF